MIEETLPLHRRYNLAIHDLCLLTYQLTRIVNFRFSSSSFLFSFIVFCFTTLTDTLIQLAAGSDSVLFKKIKTVCQINVNHNLVQHKNFKPRYRGRRQRYTRLIFISNFIFIIILTLLPTQLVEIIVVTESRLSLFVKKIKTR